MAAHEVTFSQSETLVSKVDMKFKIHGKEKLGELHISKGGIDWKPKNAKKRRASFNWEDFAALMEDYA